MVPADISFQAPHFKGPLPSRCLYESSSICDALSVSFFIAFLTGFLLRALSTALLTDFLTTLLDVFLRTVWSIALSSRLVATFLALLAFAIYQSFVRREFAMGHSHGMRLSIRLTCYGSVNSVTPSGCCPFPTSASSALMRSNVSAPATEKPFDRAQAGALSSGSTTELKGRP